jgi:hypothetical protein
MYTDNRTFILYSGPAFPAMARVFGGHSRVIRALSTHISHNGRCRSEAYMKALAAEHGAGPVQVITKAAELPQIDRNDDVVLLWADANGVGCRAVERRLLRMGARVFVVNGRRRSFELTPQRWWAIQCCRVLEKYLIGEVIFIIGFVLVTPWLIGWDWVHGRK